MLSDFTIITHQFPSREDIRLYPVSDVHLGAAEHMAREWETFCARVLDERNAYILLGGDLLNNATRSSVSNVFEETMRPMMQKEVMTKMLEPLRDRILVAVNGNHERRNRDVDDSPTYDIMCRLRLENLYRENIAFLKIQIGNPKGDGLRNPSYVLAVTHGSGGGMMTGSSVNRFERFAYSLENVDCLVAGHTHKPFVTQPARIHVDPHNNRITVKPFKVVNSTSWLSWGGYAAQKMLTPASFAPQVITLCGTKKDIRVEM